MSFVKHRYVILSISFLLVLASVVILVARGLNFGIDFEGGTLLERAFPGTVTVAQVEEVLSSEALSGYDLGGSVVQPIEEESDSAQTVMLIRTPALTESDSINAIDAAFRERFGDVTVRRTELVGPVIGRELVRQALWALVLSGIGIIVYVSLRFEYRFGIAALVALAHDVLITLGVLSLLETEINTPFVAAILTVVGYSINDTIVIFDRIRENLRLRRREPLPELVDSSIRQTLMRSINTSATTLLVTFTLYLFGGSSIRGFILTLMLGVAVGTFSSIFVASPIWLMLRGARAEKMEQAA